MKNKFLFIILFCVVISAKSQNSKTTFGLQYKPIIPASYFNSTGVIKSSGSYDFNLTPKYSNSFGMVVRHKINTTFSIESGLNYTQRNFNLAVKNSDLNLYDFTDFCNFRTPRKPCSRCNLAHLQTFRTPRIAFLVIF